MTRQRGTETGGQDQDNNSLLFKRLAEVEAKLAALDAEIDVASSKRDEAEAEMAAVQAAGGLAVSYWVAEEARDEAKRAITRLLVERRPLNEELGRLTGYAEPIRRRQLELERLRAGLAGWQRLQAVLPLLDEVAAIVDSLSPAVSRSGGSFSIDSELRRVVRMLGPQASGLARPRLEQAVRVGIDGCQASIERIEAGKL